MQPWPFYEAVNPPKKRRLFLPWGCRLPKGAAIERLPVGAGQEVTERWLRSTPNAAAAAERTARTLAISASSVPSSGAGLMLPVGLAYR
jgi:hypothetical protein